ncbi:hypothetical protein MHU86_8126 [Fragilaria crotonensis]|nr:hypothetical protein MHU86_8126 [Fragilaria crotonensis]
MTSKQQAFVGGAFVHKELQGFAAFVAYQQCHHSGGSVTKSMLEASIAEQYFGNTSNSDSIGLAEQLVGGIGIFGGLYHQSGTSFEYLTPLRHDHRTTNPPPLLLNTTSARSTLVMKPSLHCLGGHITIPVGGTNGISLPLLLQSKLHTTASNPDDHIKPRTLFTRAQEVVKNGKKALACVMAPDSPYKDYIKTGNLPSGMTHDDYLQFVRERMYFVMNPSKQCDNISANASSRNTTSSTTDADIAAPPIVDTTMGSTTAGVSANLNNHDHNEALKVLEAAKAFTFPGYIVFTLMGPIVEDFDMLCHRSDLLMTSTPVFNSTAEKKLAGRRRARQELQDANRKRHRLSEDNGDDDGDDNSSRLTRTTISSMPDDSQRTSSVASLGERLQAAGIAQSRLAHKGKTKSKLNDRIVAMHLKKVTGKQTMIQEQKFLISAAAVDDPNRPLYIIELRKLNQELG